MYRLAIEDHAGNRTVVPVARDEVTVGRRVGSTIRLTDRNVSRNHAKITLEAGTFWLTDESRYGVRVNNRRVEGRSELAWGDRVGVGDYVLTLIAEGPASSDEPGQSLGLTATVEDVAGALAASSDDPPPEDRGVVVVSMGGEELQELRLEGDELTLGRGDDNDIIIDDASLASRHARLRWLGDRWEISNLHPESGILVNGLGVEDAVLCDGDVVEVGALSLRFLAADSETLVPTLRSRVEPEAVERPWGPLALGAGVLVVGAIVLLWAATPSSPPPTAAVAPAAPAGVEELPSSAPAPVPSPVQSPPSREAQLADLTQRAVEAMGRRDWTAAIALLGRGADGGLTSPKAEAMFARAQVEQLNAARLGEAEARLEAGDVDQAFLALRAVAPGGAYAVEVQELGRRIQAAQDRRTSAGRPSAPPSPPPREVVAPRAAAPAKAKRPAPPSVPAAAPPNPQPPTPEPSAQPVAAAAKKSAAADPPASADDRRAEARRLFAAGRRLHTQGRSDDAEVKLRKAASMAPGFAEPYLVLGLIYTRAGRRSEAARSFGRFLQLAPQDKRRPMVEKMLRQVK